MFVQGELEQNNSTARASSSSSEVLTLAIKHILRSWTGAARGMSLRKVSYEAFGFSVFSRNPEKSH